MTGSVGEQQHTALQTTGYGCIFSISDEAAGMAGPAQHVAILGNDHVEMLLRRVGYSAHFCTAAAFLANRSIRASGPELRSCLAPRNANATTARVRTSGCLCRGCFDVDKETSSLSHAAKGAEAEQKEARNATTRILTILFPRHQCSNDPVSSNGIGRTYVSAAAAVTGGDDDDDDGGNNTAQRFLLRESQHIHSPHEIPSAQTAARTATPPPPPSHWLLRQNM
ncbi:hypothetical protein MKZ38_000694 [Zalerion maritima]|uniref:Uncharacterized protein n=1 Tax=Zalerion maritima TaxID=339359 RepID=A0AAD5WMM6_9PEZI|nr:hypothetical protein MKZ38_000694 [Zalerion maritima]